MSSKYITLSEYSKIIKISYRNAWRQFKLNMIPGAIQISSGKILVPSNFDKLSFVKEAVVYTRYIDGMTHTKNDQEAMIKGYLLSNGFKINGTYSDSCSRLNLPGPGLEEAINSNYVIYCLCKDIIGPLDKTFAILKPNMLFYISDIKLNEPIWADVNYISNYYLYRNIPELLVKKSIRLLSETS